MGPAWSAASDSAAYFVITIVRLPEQIRSSAVRAAPWVSYRRVIDLGWRPIESSLRADPVIDTSTGRRRARRTICTIRVRSKLPISAPFSCGLTLSFNIIKPRGLEPFQFLTKSGTLSPPIAKVPSGVRLTDRGGLMSDDAYKQRELIVSGYFDEPVFKLSQSSHALQSASLQDTETIWVVSRQYTGYTGGWRVFGTIGMVAVYRFATVRSPAVCSAAAGVGTTAMKLVFQCSWETSPLQT